MNRTLRTTLATLIAALSVAAMMDAAPAKAVVYPNISASLSISPAGTGMRSVTVSGLIQGGGIVDMFQHGFRVKVNLWGDDPIWDNRLYGPVTYSDLYFNYEIRGHDQLWFHKQWVVSSSTLNEDDSWTDRRDEVYAEVRVESYVGWLSTSARSNTVNAYF